MPPTSSIYKYLLIQIPGFKQFASHALFIYYMLIINPRKAEEISF